MMTQFRRNAAHRLALVFALAGCAVPDQPLSPAEPVPGMSGVLRTMTCRGEGDSWSFRAMFLVDSGGHLNMVTEDGTMVYLPTGPMATQPAATK